ncbi:hypothetical protein ACFX5Q_32875 [Mesorhizobium sp. IMUNJ 23033]|uniref:hypothetical protein n=1 Tax=Mesorhizobium sp. IMUNJ 23033 TaxID=3378039 RepID=UPI00384D6EED
MSQIESQIAALNRDFRMQNLDRDQIPKPFRVFAADTLIEFGLAVRDPEGNATTGVTRTRTSKSVFPYDPSDTAGNEEAGRHDQVRRLRQSRMAPRFLSEPMDLQPWGWSPWICSVSRRGSCH